MADDPTEALPIVKVDTGPLSTWTTDHLGIRFAALTPVNTRKATGVDRAEAKALFDDMAQVIQDHATALQAAEDGKGRIRDARAQLLTENRELREQIAELKGHDRTRLPTRAVAEVVAATRHGEATVDLVLEDARRRANLILEDARSKATATLGAAEPIPTGHRPTDVAAEAEWLALVLPPVEQRLHELLNRRTALADEVEQRTAEHEQWAKVLPLAAHHLTGAIEVSEVAS